MFLGREKELRKLNKLWNSNSFEMVIIYGRRRVGKTTLINEFCKEKKHIFFAAMESTKDINLNAFSESLFAFKGKYSGVSFNKFEDIFDNIRILAEKERIILVIDEYPYLAKSFSGISSMLQNFIDHYFKKTKFFIILCGSSMSFMENQVLGYESPLYGRRTAQLKILPFNYYDTIQWFHSYNLEDKSLAYGISGGIPLYVERLSKYKNIKEAMLNELFDNSGYLFEEPKNLLKQELREPALYNAIVTAIANGSSKLSEISTKVSLDTGTCSKYISVLISLGIIIKIMPINESSSKKSIYKIEDMLFRFWYRFIPANMSGIVSERIFNTFDRSVTRYISDYMGLVFEEMCKQYLLYYAQNLPIDIGDIGQWWGTDNKRKRQVEIDIVVISPDKKSCLFCECKYKNELMDESVLNQLIENANAFGYLENRYYCLFSKSGFTEKLNKRAIDKNILLLTLKDISK
jgi:AAA+ ATPase superfamily predicted ATPase